LKYENARISKQWPTFSLRQVVIGTLDLPPLFHIKTYFISKLIVLYLFSFFFFSKMGFYIENGEEPVKYPL
jgi:hypothetical protein